MKNTTKLFPSIEETRPMNKLLKMCMMVAVFAIVSGLYASSSYAQGSCYDGTNLTPVFCNETTGYQIGGSYVLTLPPGGPFNTGVGVLALVSNTSGSFNTATGNSALQFNTTGPHNTADGTDALVFNTTGGDNTGMGYGAGFANTTGSLNTALGFSALAASNGSDNTALGANSCLNVTTGINVTCIGDGSGPLANVPGHATYIANVYNRPTTGKNNPEVCISKDGLLGTRGCVATIQLSEQAQRIADLEQRLARLESLVQTKSN